MHTFFRYGLATLITCLTLLFMNLSPLASPPGAVGPYLNGAFTPDAPGEGGRFELEEVFPGQSFYGPMRMVAFPGSEEEVVILGLAGEVWVANMATQESRKVLDIRERVANFNDAGAVGLAFHPQFNDVGGHREVFIYYHGSPTPDVEREEGYNRLSRFQWDDELGAIDPHSEEVLINQFDRKFWHAGGGMQFGPDGFLYLAMGDEGLDGDFLPDANQRLDLGLFGGIVRIDVDNDPTRSHPIRRQPGHATGGPEDWPTSYTQGYGIPNDNPWLAEDGSILEEFYAIGIRSPFSLHFDPGTGDLYLNDVGSILMEEISRVEKGDNLQWPWMEGAKYGWWFSKPEEEDLIGREKMPFVAYDRDIGSCIMPGGVYRGDKFSDLRGQFIFGDWGANRILSVHTDSAAPEIVTLIGDVTTQPVPLPDGARFTGVFPAPNGDVLVMLMGNRSRSAPGKIYRFVKRGGVPEPVLRLSETGAFADLATLEPAPGVLPYRTNAALYSDNAEKLRWLAVPNDGAYDTPEEQIGFQRDGEWDFPAGTVLIKHFELPTVPGDATAVMRLETRFFIVGEGGRAYGLTYRWNEEGTEAFLIKEAETRLIDVYDEEGNFAYQQEWRYPSRDQCMTCHTAASGHVLGVKTHQLNGNLTYPRTGRTVNQIEHLRDLGVLAGASGPLDSLPKAYALLDASASLDVRVRSYLDANCASCHRQGGAAGVAMDLRFDAPMSMRGIIEAPNLSHSSTPGGLIVRPGHHTQSELWLRDASTETNQMPPLGRTMADEHWVDSLAVWIDGLLESPPAPASETILYPNPTTDFIKLELADDWVGPFDIKLFDMHGRHLADAGGQDYEVVFDMRLYPNGLYVLTIEGGDGRRLARKFLRR